MGSDIMGERGVWFSDLRVIAFWRLVWIYIDEIGRIMFLRNVIINFNVFEGESPTGRVLPMD